MKNIDEIFKNALSSHEAPYKEGAWEAMQAKMNGTPAKSPFPKKWFYGAASIVLIGGLSTLLYFNSSDEKEQIKLTASSSSTNSTITTNDELNSEINTNSSQQKKLDKNLTEINENEAGTVNASSIFHASAIDKAIKTSFDNIYVENQNNQENSDKTKTTVVNTTNEEFKALEIKSKFCLGETVDLYNPNSKLVLISVPGKKSLISLEGKESVSFKAENEGTISILSSTNSTPQTAEVVAPNSRLYINVDAALLYENGIPNMKFEVSGNDAPVTWSTNIKGNSKNDNTLIVHPYQEKVVNVTVQSEDKNGCKVSETIQVPINSAYNLMAMTGFKPNSPDPDVNRFMPFALKERNTPFRMIIIDPKTGAKVFETSDASEGWDGINRTTGELVKEGSIWIWKVILKEPNLGEQAEYSSTITRL